MVSRSASGGPRTAQEVSPRSRQERRRSAPRAAQEANKRSKKGSSYRFRSWGGLGRPPGAILKRFGSDFGASGVAFWSHFQDFFFVSSDLLRPPAREAFQATPQLKTLSGGAERAREA